MSEGRKCLGRYLGVTEMDGVGVGSCLPGRYTMQYHTFHDIRRPYWCNQNRESTPIMLESWTEPRCYHIIGFTGI